QKMKRKIILFQFCILIFIARLCAGDSFLSDLDRYLQSQTTLNPAATQLPVLPYDRLSVDAYVSAVSAHDNRESAKFEEYRDIPNGALTYFAADYWGENHRFFGSLKNVGLDDQFFQFRTESFGKYRVDFSYNQIPHRYAFDAQTLFSGIGTGDLRIADNLQTFFQNSTSEADLAKRMQLQFAKNATLFDLENLRKQASVSVDVFAFQPWRVKAELKYEKRSGEKPFSGSFGFGNFVELAAPTDYDTTNVKVGSEYTNHSMYINASYSASVFTNNVTALTFD